MNLNERTFASEEEYRDALIQELDKTYQESRDPNTKWLSEEEFDAWVEGYMYAMEHRDIAKSA